MAGKELSGALCEDGSYCSIIDLDFYSPEELGYMCLNMLSFPETFVLNEDFLRAIVNEGADLRVRGGIGTPLHIAAFYGYHSIVRFLLDSKAPKDALNDMGRTAWDLASEQTRTYCPDLEP